MFMKEELKEIFDGVLKKLPLTIFCGLGVGFFTLLLTGIRELNNIKIVHENAFNSIISHNPFLFWISFLVGVLWSNSIIKEIRILSFRKAMYRMPIILIWLIAMLLLNKWQPITACKQYCLAAGATKGNIAYTQNVMRNIKFYAC